MKKTLIITAAIFTVLFFQDTSFAQQAKTISSAEFEKIYPYVDYVDGYPKDKMPDGVTDVIIYAYNDVDSARLIYKLKNSYKVFPAIKSEFNYNWAKRIGAEYKNGFIEVSSIMPFSETSSTGIFKIAGGKQLIFIKQITYSPNVDIEQNAENALAKGDIKTAADLFNEKTYPPLNYYEETQKKLLKRAHEVALKQFKAKEYTKAAETMGYAYDFWDIDEESDLYFDKKMVSILADYTYFLEKAKMYQKCIKVAEAFTFTVIDVAGPYMHLGDSYYHTNKKQKALEAYKTYSDLRIKQGAEKRIPSYVKKRIAELDTKSAGIFTDSRDGITYKTVKIGNQVWMAENFAYKPQSGKFGGFDGNYWAYDDKASNIEKYGYLYDWATAQKIAPKGWHLPTKEEFETLLKNYGEKPFDELSQEKNGLNVVYSGWFYQESMAFAHEGNEIGFWSATKKNDKEAWLCIIEREWKHVFIRTRFMQGVGAAVRLIKD